MFFKEKIIWNHPSYLKKRQNTFKLTAPGPSYLCIGLPEKHLAKGITELHTIIQNASKFL